MDPVLCALMVSGVLKGPGQAVAGAEDTEVLCLLYLEALLPLEQCSEAQSPPACSVTVINTFQRSNFFFLQLYVIRVLKILSFFLSLPPFPAEPRGA